MEKCKNVIISQIAFKLFIEKGYEATNIGEICKLAGVEPPILYHYFKSKRGLFFAICEDIWKRYREQLDQLDILEKDVSPDQKLFELMRLKVNYAKAHRQDIKFYIRYMYFPPEDLKQEIKKTYEQLIKEKERDIAHTIIRQCVDENLIYTKDIEEAWENYGIFVFNKVYNAAFFDCNLGEDELRDAWGIFLHCYMQGQAFLLNYYDNITGLPNMLKLEKDLKNEIERRPEIKKAVLNIDIHNYDTINRIMGYAFGDKLMKIIAGRFLSLFKKQPIYKNVGGNFTLFIKEYDDEKEVEELAVLILQSLKKVFEIEGFKINLSSSVGIALYPEHGMRATNLLEQSRIAIYQGKRADRNGIWFYDCDKGKKAKDMFIITQDLYTAIANREFELFYQPQFDLQAEKITGFEALVRWKHPRLGLLSPLTFIEMAEKTGLIIPIGEHILISACIFLKKLHNQGYTDIAISVNVSVPQLLDQAFYDNIYRILRFIDLEPRCLELEITESILIEEYEYIIGKLRQLRQRGIHVAIDDFGQGYSSLAYLRNLPADTLKIDKIFTDDILEFHDGGNHNKIIDSIIVLGKNMGLTVLAEGVETKAQMSYLKDRGCHKIQGYYLSKPVPEKEAVLLLDNQQD